MGKDNEWTREDTQGWREDNYGDSESGRAISRAEHQARNDYQDDGEPFGPLSHRDRGSKSDVPSRDSDDSGGGGGSCYVATATLVGQGAAEQLDILRQWRDQVLRSNKRGRRLEKIYNRIGPRVAALIKRRPGLASSCLHAFVKPSVWLACKRPQLRFLSSGRNFALYFLFLGGLAYGTMLVLCFGEGHKS